ncbi:hypothetical protein BESB_019000 [Besnoitia besnoiti]|uniref:GCC2 and GCC3 domain-containing protein n=1 Tax=Besnoitia besnoiti TaxID=94643 RepID=A0A2A9M1W6_BESBE|nr:hypothetical protein BESB_019000 [Besnoitia besnoiti]PFH31959.1 hypothetical protein BESB_019000 [Besnoitia besnoiti]
MNSRETALWTLFLLVFFLALGVSLSPPEPFVTPFDHADGDAAFRRSKAGVSAGLPHVLLSSASPDGDLESDGVPVSQEEERGAERSGFVGRLSRLQLRAAITTRQTASKSAKTTPETTDPAAALAACGSGIYRSWTKTVSTSNSMNCWNICSFVEDAVYDKCVQDAHPHACLAEAARENPLIPSIFKERCVFAPPTVSFPLFWETKPDSEHCLKEGMIGWLQRSPWENFSRNLPSGCTYPNWDPAATVAAPRSYINDVKSAFGKAVAQLRAEEFHVIVRGAEEAAKNPVENGAFLASSIVPKTYWDTAKPEDKDGWHITRTFSVPQNRADFAALTTKDDGSSSSAAICLYSALAIQNHTGGAVTQFTNYGMVPQVKTCDGQIGTLWVADIRGRGLFESSDEEVDRKTGFNLCVARRWTVGQTEADGVHRATQTALFHVGFDAPCASFLSGYTYKRQNALHAGQWEQHFVARTYPLVRGISEVDGSNRCPWGPSVQYGLKCFTSVEQDNFLYMGSFAEGQLSCRRLVLDRSVPSSFSRVAVVQGDHDLNVMGFLAEPASFTWVGLFQGEQALLPVRTNSSTRLRVVENACPEETLTASRRFWHRHSEIEETCKAKGADINQPAWRTTWTGADGDTEIESWDIKWCSGHPRTMENTRYVDCAGIRVTDRGVCIESAPCDQVNSVFCTYPVDYGPRPVATTLGLRSDKVTRLPPAIECTVGSSCTVDFNLKSSAASSAATLPAPSDAIWGIPYTGGRVALKLSCMAVDGSMVGPYDITSKVDLSQGAQFSTMLSGIYELCYCNEHSSATTVERSGQAPDAACTRVEHFSQMIATVTVADGSESVAFKQAIQLPASPPSLTGGSLLSLEKGGLISGAPAAFCGWERYLEPLCTFQVKPTARALKMSLPSDVTLWFIPALSRSASNQNICFFQTQVEAEAVVTVAGDEVINVEVPMETPSAFFYAICEEATMDFLGFLSFKETIAAVSVPLSVNKIEFAAGTQVNGNSVVLDLGGAFTERLLKRSSLLVISVDNVTDANCEQDLEILSPTLVTRPALPELNAETSTRLELNFDAGPSVKKLCWLETIHFGGNVGTVIIPQYLASFPRVSEVQNLTPADSRCFLKPAETPCKFKVTPKALPPEDNPAKVRPYLSRDLHVYLMEDACPTRHDDAVFDVIDTAGNESAENVNGVMLRLEAESETVLQAVLEPSLLPWLAARGTANLCWTHTRKTSAASCPIGGHPCAGTFGKAYAVGSTSDATSNVVVCEEGSRESCLVRVQGHNLNLYEKVTNRLAALVQCGATPGIGLLAPWGDYHSLVASSSAAPQGASPPTSENSTGSSLAVSPVSPFFFEASQTPSKGTSGRNDTLHAQQGQPPFLSFMAAHGDLDPALANNAANSTALYYEVPYETAGGNQQLCFRSDALDTQDLERFTEPVGQVVFARQLHSAELRVYLEDEPLMAIYAIEITVPGTKDGAQKPDAVYLKPVHNYPAGSTVPCDYDKDLSGPLRDDIIGPILPFSEMQRMLPENADDQFTFRRFVASDPPPKVMAVCWSEQLYPGSSGAAAKTAADAIWHSVLVGYYAGRALPAPPNEGTGVAVSCGLGIKACQITLTPRQAATGYYGGISSGAATFLDPHATVVMDTQLTTATCPADPLDAVYTQAIAQTSTTGCVLPSGPRLAADKAVLLLDEPARELLKTQGKAGLCYRLPNCRVDSNSPSQPCTQYLGIALWLGPTRAEPSDVALCNRLGSRGCLLTLKGLNMDAVGYSVPRLAYAEACGKAGDYWYANVVERPVAKSAMVSPPVAFLEAEAPASGASPFLGERDWDQLPLREDNLSVTFEVDIQLASAYELCWNPFEQNSEEAKGADESRFIVSLGHIFFLPLPFVVIRQMAVNSVDDARLVVIVNAISTKASASNVERYVYTSPVQETSDDLAKEAECTDTDSETKIDATMSFEKEQTLFQRRQQEREAAQQVSLNEQKPESDATVAVDMLTFLISAGGTRQKICWRSVYKGAQGQVLYDYRVFLSTVPAAGVPELDTTAHGQPVTGLALCSLGANEKCAVTLRPKSSPNSKEPPFFAPGGELYLLKGDVCPQLPTDPRIANTEMRAALSPETEAVHLDVVMSERDVKTYSSATDYRKWVSAQGRVTICYRYGANLCPAPDRCFEKLGSMYWRGPRAEADTDLRVLCQDPQGCQIKITGLNLNLYDLSYSRVAALKTCGSPGGVGLLDVAKFPPGYTRDPVPPALEDHFDPGGGLGRGIFVVSKLGRGVLTCGASKKVKVKEAWWVVSGEPANGAECQRKDVTSLVASHCAKKQICVIYPHTPEDDRTVKGLVGLNNDEFLQLDSPCYPPTGNELKLTGAYECTAERPSSWWPQFLETRASVRAIDYSKPSTEVMEMSVTFPSGIASMFNLCWNPDQDLALEPSRYTEKLGFVQAVPTAGLSDLISMVYSRIDSTYVEVVVTGIVDEESAYGTYVYAVDIPPEGALECKSSDSETANSKSVFMSYDSGDSGVAVIRYRIKAPPHEKGMCWHWTNDKLAADGGEQRILLGTLPGAVNPKPRAWGEMMCSGSSGAKCSIKFEPDTISSVYPAPGSDSGTRSGFTDYSKYANLHSHFRPLASLGLIAGRDACPEDPEDLAYTRFQSTFRLKTTISERDLQESTIGLPISTATVASLSSALSDAHLMWLAEHKDAVVCWVNNGGCAIQKTPRSLPCAATVGLLSWMGPVPSAWTQDFAAFNCRAGSPCTLRIRGRNLFKMDMTHSRVSVVKQCGGSDGPGIAKIKTRPTLSAVPVAPDAEDSESLLETRAAGRTKGLGAFWRVGRPRRLGRHRRPPTCGYGARGGSATSKCSSQQGHVSTLQTRSRTWAIPSSSVDDVLEVETTLSTGEVFLICWNPAATPTTELADFSMPIGEVVGYGLQPVKAFCYSGSLCEVMIDYHGPERPNLFVGVKAVDCSDPNLTDELGNGGKFQFTGKQRLIFSHPIPPKEDIQRAEYKLCWCDKAQESECVGTAYSEPAGSLTVQFIPETGVMCLPFTGPCKFAFPNEAFQGDEAGTVFLAGYSGTDADCTLDTRYTPVVSAAYGELVFEVDQRKLSEALGSDTVAKGTFAVCRETSTGRNDRSGGSSELQITRSPARLGALGFAGPSDPDFQFENQVAVLGMPTRVVLVSQGFKSLVGLDFTQDPFVMPSYRQVRLAPKGTCGAATEVGPIVLKLSAVTASLVPFHQNTEYSRPEVLKLPNTGITKLDVCWCDPESSCENDGDFSVPVLSVNVVSPAQNVAVLCTYGTKCPFTFDDVAGQQEYGMDSDVHVMRDVATELPDRGRLVAVQPVAKQQRHATESRKWEFSGLVSRASVFSGDATSERVYTLCYCALKQSGCTPDVMFPVGKMTIYDVWDGTTDATMYDKVVVRPRSPPFDGNEGHVYAAAGDVELPVTMVSSMMFEVTLVDLITVVNPEATVNVTYCERTVAENCDAADAPRIELMNIIMKGPASGWWVSQCVMGVPCAVTTKVFHPADGDKVAALKSCGASYRTDYGESSKISFPQVADQSKPIDTTFAWTENFPDSGLDHMPLCWCKKSSVVDCTRTEQYGTEVGILLVSGLETAHRGSCTVGRTCRLDFTGFRLQHNTLNLRVMKDACGPTGNPATVLPNEGILTLESHTDEVANFLLEPYRGRSLATTRVCQCPKPTSECTSPGDYDWHVGDYYFSGPLDVVALEDAASTRPLDKYLPWDGGIDSSIDFFMFTGDKECRGTMDGSESGLPRHGIGTVDGDGRITWPALGGGGIYAVCYCPRTSHLDISAGGDPFAFKGEENPSNCNTPAGYIIPVAVALVTGPSTKGASFVCMGGTQCTIEIDAVHATSTSYILSNAVADVRQASCSSGSSLMKATVQGTTDSEAPINEPLLGLQMNAVKQTFLFSTAVRLAAGSYEVCWRISADSREGIALGKLHVKGPVDEKAALTSLSGKPVEVGVTYAGTDNPDELDQMRIRIYPVPRGEEKERFDCSVPNPNEQHPYERFMTVDRRPDAIEQQGPNMFRLLWRNLILVVDENTPGLPPGSAFAVCICDGARSDCSSGTSYFLQVASWVVHGPSPRTVKDTVTIGTEFTYTITGVGLPPKNSVFMLPASDLTTGVAFSCGDAGLEPYFFPTSARATSDTSNRVTFTHIVVSSASKSVRVCWCGGDNCTKPEDFKTSVSELDVQYPSFEPVSAIIGGTFSITLRGTVLRPNDAVTVISPTKQCGAEGADQMDSSVVDVPTDSPVTELNNLGMASSVEAGDGGTSGGDLSWSAESPSLLWRSWPIRAKETASGYLRVCYCSSEAGVCTGAKRFNVWVGSVHIQGPSTRGIKIIQVDGEQKLQVTGTGLSLTNELRVYLRAPAALHGAREMRHLCESGASGYGVAVSADGVNSEGTEATFPVSLEPGFRYILCWSAGTGSAPVPASGTARVASSAASPKLELAGEAKAEAEVSTPALVQDEIQKAVGFIMQDNQLSATAGDPETQQTQSVETDVKSKAKWTYLTQMMPTGFRPGQLFKLVQGYVGEVLYVRGSPDPNEEYVAYFGKPDIVAGCDEIKDAPHLTFSEIVERDQNHVSFRVANVPGTGMFAVCVCTTSKSECYDAGTATVVQFYWKTVAELVNDDRFFMLPCHTRGHAEGDAAGAASWSSDRVWLPDGMGAWSFPLGTTQIDQSKSVTILSRVSNLDAKWVNFYSQGMRSTVACAGDQQERVFFLGPGKVYMMNPVSGDAPNLSTATGEVFSHPVLKPLDLAVREPYIFFSDYESQVITTINIQDPSLNRMFFPTNPVMLFSAGVEVVDVDDATMALLVADTFNHIVGRLNIPLAQMRGAQQGVTGTPWTAYFGTPKTAQHGTHGFSYPFALSKYIPTGKPRGGSSASLILVTELVTDRLVFLNVENNNLTFYRQISFEGRHLISGMQSFGASLLLIARTWPPSVTTDGLDAFVGLLSLRDLIGNLYFTYPEFRTKLQSGLFYSFEPLVTGPAIQFFREERGSNLSELGLKLDPKTGVISGTVSHTGSFTVSITGGDLLETYTWTVIGDARCRAGEYFESTKNACELCPVGTFRDQEATLQECHTIKPYSTTLSAGSTQLAQCRCLPGFEIGSLGDCHPCGAGAYKASISDTKCTGRCPPNMHSYIFGADSEEALLCSCDAGYYLDNDTCKPCPQGSYCEGEDSPPTKCPENFTTRATVSKSLSDCVCIEGYTRQEDKCVQCDRLSYKGSIGNEACTPCPQPASKGDTGSLHASTNFNEVQFTSSTGAKRVSDCSLCASGFYYEATSGGCTPCRKNYYCPGKAREPVACAENAATVLEGAESALNCNCPKGYGKSMDRSPVDNTLICVECPKNTFQHLDGMTIGCLPCPPFTMTKTTKASSFSACVARPGYFLSSRLEQLISDSAGHPSLIDEAARRDVANEHLRRESSEFASRRMTSASEEFQNIRTAESKYEIMGSSALQEVHRICEVGTGLISRVMPEVKMRIYTPSFQTCVLSCVRNVYCTSLSFTQGSGSFLSTMTAVTNHTGTYLVTYSVCELHFYGPDLEEEAIETVNNPFTDMVVGEGMTVSCAIKRPGKDMTWRRVTYEECPMNAYCPGDQDGQIYECPLASVTLAHRASSSDHCKCIPGYHLVGRQCEPCNVGTYKNTTDNALCAECPAGFTTADVASTSAYECACTPGTFMLPAPNMTITAPSEEEASSDVTDSENHVENKEPAENEASGDEPKQDPEKQSPEDEQVSVVQLSEGLAVRGDRGILRGHPRATGHAGSRKDRMDTSIFEERGVTFAETMKVHWLEPDIREQLEKVVTLHQCVSCHKQMYCPGLWLDPPLNSTHMPPQLCPDGANVPSSTVLADSVEKCLCLPGYGFAGTAANGEDGENLNFKCAKCASGTYKELQENAPCSGRCMRDAETIEGAVAKIQCFCKIGKYAVQAKDAEGIITCHDCIAGGVCPGGLKTRARRAVEEDHNFVDITIDDHQVPFPSTGFFAVYKPLNATTWKPSMVPMVASFTGDTFVDFEAPPPEDEDLESLPGSLSGAAASGEPGVVIPPGSGQLPSGEPRRSQPKEDAVVSALQLRVRDVDFIVESARYDRIPDIHPCFDDMRCRGGPRNTCVDGSAGYLCSACAEGHSQVRYKSGCNACLSVWLDTLVFVLSRIVVCAIIWIIASLSIVAVEQQACTHPVLVRILISNMFFFSIYGLMPETTQSQLSEWTGVYRVFFLDLFFATHPYLKVSCFLPSMGIELSDAHQWYWQHFFQIFVPFLDVVLLTILGAIAVTFYKVVYSRYIDRVRVVLHQAREAHGDDTWTERTIRKVEAERCLGMFRYISADDMSGWRTFLRLLEDLIPAYTVIWFWHFPTFVVECTTLMGCIDTQYKSEPPFKVLAGLPIQACNIEDPYYLAGLCLGGAGLFVWGVASIVAFIAYMSTDHSSDTIGQRFKHGFLANGYHYEYRWWEGIISLRKTCVALIITMHVHLNSSGAQEIFRNSANLAVTMFFIMVQLQVEPFDKRSHNLANRVEFYGLLCNIANGIIIQGSYYFELFKYSGAFPLAITAFYYLYVIWTLFVEWGRMVMMRPYLVNVPSFWRYYNRVTRSLARLYTSGNAKIYYNYITKDMVLEAATKSRVFHLRRLLLRKKKTTYRKINYENRTYFVAALRDSLSQLVIAWCQFSIPGDWLDFTIRYAFCYCFWQRYQDNRSLRVPLDLEEFEAIKPTLFSDWYYDNEQGAQEDGDGDDGAESLEVGEITFNTAEEDFLDLMLDDDVYDDSPITLMELYVAVQSMQHIPQRQLRRLHVAYRERMAQAGNSMVPQLRKENEELEVELQELNRALQEMTATDEDATEITFSLLDFFFTVEMVNQAKMEVERLRGEIDKEIDEIERARTAKAMAVHLELGMDENADIESLLESMEADEQRGRDEQAARVGYIDESRKRLEKRKEALADRRVALGIVGKRTLQMKRDEKRRAIVRPGSSPTGEQRTLSLALGPNGKDSGAKRRIALNRGPPPRTVGHLSERSDLQHGLSRPGSEVSDADGKRRVGVHVQGGARSVEGISGESQRRVLRPGSQDSAAPAEGKRTIRLGSDSGPGAEATSSAPEQESKRTLSLSSSRGGASSGGRGDTEAERSTSPAPPTPVRRVSRPGGDSSAGAGGAPEAQRSRDTPADLGSRRRVGGLGTPRASETAAGEAASSEAGVRGSLPGPKRAAVPKGQGLPMGKRKLGKFGDAKQD